MKKIITKYQLEYRWDGHWYPLGKFDTRSVAVNFAEDNRTCQQNGYQVKPIKARG